MGAAQPLAPTLRAIAARCLNVPPDAIDPAVPLTRYGLDSLNAAELGVAIEEATGIALDADVLIDAPSIAALERHLLGMSAPDAIGSRVQRMRVDALLDEDIVPPRATAGSDAPVLLTGATGFLGAHLLAHLLAAGVPRIVCPVRANDDAHAHVRIRAGLAHYGIAIPDLELRVHALASDLAAPGLGIASDRYAALARSIGSIYHCAAEVNWALPYEALCRPNVEATRALLRFACSETAKAVHFVSSVAACYSTRDPGPVDEQRAVADPAGIHLGYGQSKWVAERLIEAAARRGLAATIYRPSLIAGASDSGLGNDDDFLARMLRGSIALGYAPEIDWRLDACPVDFVAAGIAALGRSTRTVERVVHLRNPRPARWTEAVLWMNLRGYPVQLEPIDAWLARVERETRDPGHPLQALRGFLLHLPPGEGGRTLPEIYADRNVARLEAVRSDAALAGLGVACPRLSAGLLERYFDVWAARGLLPQVPTDGSARCGARGHAVASAAVEHALRTHFDDPRLRVTAARRVDLGSEHSILGELTSWRAGSDLAIHGLALAIAHGDGKHSDLDLVVKPKPSDRVVLGVTEEVATLCDPALGAAFATYANGSELAGGDSREIAIYTGASGALAAYTPACYGVVETRGGRALLLERIRDPELIDGVNDVALWTPARIDAAICGIARVHAQWLGREQAVAHLLGNDEMCKVSNVDAAQAWRLALASFARPWFEQWIGPSGAREQLRLVERGTPTAGISSSRRTLIHNDFNPRNIALERGPDGLQLRAFDWELAAFGLPQRDLAELLCFVLPPDAAEATIAYAIESHRLALERASGTRYARDEWIDGVRHALVQFGAERLPMYCIAHRFRPQPFLERVARTWYRLTRASSCATAPTPAR